MFCVMSALIKLFIRSIYSLRIYSTYSTYSIYSIYQCSPLKLMSLRFVTKTQFQSFDDTIDSQTLAFLLSDQSLQCKVYLQYRHSDTHTISTNKNTQKLS